MRLLLGLGFLQSGELALGQDQPLLSRLRLKAWCRFFIVSRSCRQILRMPAFLMNAQTNRHRLSD